MPPRPALRASSIPWTATPRGAHEGEPGSAGAVDRRFRAWFDASAAAGWVQEPRGRIVVANRALRRLLGVPADELVGRDSASLAHPDWVSRLHDINARLGAGQIPELDEDLLVARGDGRVVVARCTLCPIAVDEDETPLVLVQLDDVTALRRTEARLRRQSALTETLATCSHRLQASGADCSPALDATMRELARLYEGTSAVLAGDGDSVRIVAFAHHGTGDHEAARARVVDAAPGLVPLVARVADGEEPVLRFGRDPDGAGAGRDEGGAGRDEGPARAVGAMLPLRRATGVLGVLAVWPGGRDGCLDGPEDGRILSEVADLLALAMENARLVRELQEGEERFRSAFDDAPIGVVMSSLDAEDYGRFLRVNRAFCDLTGYSPAELRSMRFQDILHPDELATVPSGPATIRARPGGPVDLERRYVRKDGRTIWVRVNVSVISGEGTRHAVAHVQDISDTKETEHALERLALFDEITGLANRHQLMDHLRLAVAGLSRGSAGVGVIFVDLDEFKDVNDTRGHEEGDKVLVEIARRIRRAVRSVDTAGRLAGDEFVVVCPAVDGLADVGRIAERLHVALEQPVDLTTGSVVVGASIGVTLATSPAVAPEELLRQADAAMYDAKQRGRHCWETYREPEVGPRRARRGTGR